MPRKKEVRFFSSDDCHKCLNTSMNETSIYLVFTKSNTWLSRTIGFFEPTEYIHTALALTDDFDTLYSFGRQNPDDPFSGGFAMESLYRGVYQRSPESPVSIYRMRVTEAQHAALKLHIQGFLSNKEHYRYNLLGLVSCYFQKPLERQRHYFCSEFVSEALSVAKVLELERPPSLTRTMDLLSMGNKELVFKGRIGDLQPTLSLHGQVV